MDEKVTGREHLVTLGLSKRESEVAEVVIRSTFRNKQIARMFFVTEKCIKFHLTNVYKKLDVPTRKKLRERFSNIFADATNPLPELPPLPPPPVPAEGQIEADPCQN
jgi:DNA-binding CsgD family transcriptional regulator